MFYSVVADRRHPLKEGTEGRGEYDPPRPRVHSPLEQYSSAERFSCNFGDPNGAPVKSIISI